MAGLPRELDERARRAFLAFGSLTLLLCLDDAFKLHEYAAPALVERGELLLIVVYAALLGAVVRRHRLFVLRSSYPLLLVSGALFLVSIACDRWLPDHHLIEDGTKFLGIATWATWLMATGIVALRTLGRGNSGNR